MQHSQSESVPHSHAPHNLETIIPPWVSMFRSAFPTATVGPETLTSTQLSSQNLPSYPFTLSTVSLTDYTDDTTAERKTLIRPHARTCMFRGFAISANSGILSVTTDKRMPKFAQLSSTKTPGIFEACFYFPQNNKQFRFAGRSKLVYLSSSQQVILHDAAEGKVEAASSEVEAEFYKAWDSLSPMMRLSFCKPSPGSELTMERWEVLENIEKATDETKAGAPVAPELLEEGKQNFVLILLGPETVDYVDVEGIGQRILFTRANEYEWEFHEICP
ncbi:pyridoxamine 5'-phosphate oxidase-domain-containing protein [Lipomyces tetrasporus]|uniref:Pyridoxamine 5'-phosphate oxidase-domain-containing protein n=1 Tax=Lipomyces tetrasporus TaxID=54092 RepID=A0AAD7VUV1_9ASCO|nr:pyridoxamine 5'-phosphate oxidase-domain-containing protein [Lipomyces tetrasporus]KAJ8102878.1 pyridoxamine 5'-phosphate oxidase-domain-containing protein [Lipomyces tetrasporus]